MAEKRLGIDLGTSTIRIAEEGRGIVLREASVIALDAKSGRVVAGGDEARRMWERAPDSLRIVRPIVNGAVADYESAQKLIRYMVGKVCAYRILKPRVAVSIPACVTEVEQRSVVQAMTAVGVRRVALIEEYVAAAVGAGLDVTQPHGCMTVDMGAGTTAAVILSLRGVAASASERLGGDNLDEAIVQMLRAQCNHIIGLSTAEQVKKQIGSVRASKKTMEVRGRDALTGLPCVKTVTAEQVREAIFDEVRRMVATVQQVLEYAPPETIADVLTDGIVLTGGTAQLDGLAEYMTACTGVECRVAPDPENCVVLGLGQALKSMKETIGGVYDVNEFAYDRTEWEA